MPYLIPRQALLATLLVGAVLDSSALEYSLETELDVVARHDDNIRLRVNDEESVSGYRIEPRIKSKVRSDNWETSADLKLGFSEFSDDGFDSNDQYLTLSGEREGERYSTRLTANVTRDTTRTSEEDDSGRVSNDRREFYALSPYWQYRVTQKNLLSLSGNASKADYKSTSYTGYEYWSAQAQWTYLYTQRLRFSANLNTSDYSSDERADNRFSIFGITQATNSESLGYQLGVSYQVTTKLSLEALWGQSHADTSYETGDPNNFCVIFACDIDGFKATSEQVNAGLEWKNERHSLSASYTIDSRPSSDSYVLEQETYKLNWAYRLGENNRVSVNTRYGENEALGGADAGSNALSSERKYLTAEARYHHRVFERWYVNAKLRYRYQDYATVEGSAEGLGATIGITYRPTKFIW